MTQSLTLKIRGLYTNPNELSAIPEGALLQADDIDISSEGLAQPRRGFDRLTTGYSTSTGRTDALFSYQDKLIAHNGTLGSADTLTYYNSGTWTNLSGTYLAPTGYKMRMLEASQNAYLTTSSGVYRMDSYSSTPALSGAYKGLDVSASVSASSSTWLSNNYRTAYRVVWGYRDANDNLILGAPSQRESYKNVAGSTKALDLRITIPSGVTTSWFVQVYRASAVDNTSNDTEPSDEMGLVYETSPASGDITNGYIDITDITPDELRGATIYTAASQEGLANGNERPPLAKDIAFFRDSVFYANTTSKHRYYLTVLAIGGSNGLATSDTITIGGITYTAESAEDIAAAEFELVSSGSASQNIRDTALSLVRVINRHTSSTVYAYYLSGPDDLPGKLLLEERALGGSSFAVTSDNGTFSNPALPSSGTTESSTNDTFKNGLYWSKPSQPEHVPLVNFTTVGDKDKEIKRIIALKDSLLIFKEEGIYRLTGYYPSFTIDLLDSSSILVGAETPAVLNNTIFCLTTQGITAVGDSVSVISLPIEDAIREKIANNLSGVSSLAFGVGYEAERKWLLFLPDNSGSNYCESAFVYNSFTRAFTKYNKNASCGHVDADNNLYLGDGGSNYILSEKKTYSYTDYADFGFSSSISAASGTTITLGSGIDGVSVGDILYQSSTVFANVTAVDADVSQVTVTTNPGFSVAACSILTSINSVVKFAPITIGNAAVLKQFHTAQLLLKSEFQGTATLGFTTELSQAEETVTLTGSSFGLWGLFTWGEAPWGGSPIRRPVRQWVPREKQRASQLIVSFSHSYAYSEWKLQGIALFGEFGSEKVAK